MHTARWAVAGTRTLIEGSFSVSMAARQVEITGAVRLSIGLTQPASFTSNGVKHGWWPHYKSHMFCVSGSLLGAATRDMSMIGDDWLAANNS